jgi:CRISPR-associated protein Csd1
LLRQNKIKGADRVSFRVDGVPITALSGVDDWWQHFRPGLFPVQKKAGVRCLVTGELTQPLLTTPKIQGLRSVGGHGNGDALICFDKASFQSYGLKKCENAPVSAEGFAAVKAALDELLQDAPRLAGMKFVHWYDRDIAPQNDPLFQCEDFGFGDLMDEAEGDEEATEEEQLLYEAAARRRADSVVQNVLSEQERVYDLRDTSYYILLLSGVNSRVMVRRWERGNYQTLRDNLEQWHQDLSLTNPMGNGDLKGVKLTARLIRLLKYQKMDRNVFQRLDKELAGITPWIIQSILTGCALPTAVAMRAMAYIRSKMLGAGDDDTVPIPDGMACQWLKAWLIRENRRNNREEFLMKEYNFDHPEPAYHCGGLMAVYAAIQRAAMPGVKAGVVSRYYASACQTPALVLAQLSKLANYHLQKIDNEWRVRRYQERLEQLYNAVGYEIPATLTLEKQAYFPLGFYQMQALLNKEEQRGGRKQQNIADDAKEE